MKKTISLLSPLLLLTVTSANAYQYLAEEYYRLNVTIGESEQRFIHYIHDDYCTWGYYCPNQKNLSFLIDSSFVKRDTQRFYINTTSRVVSLAKEKLDELCVEQGLSCNLKIENTSDDLFFQIKSNSASKLSLLSELGSYKISGSIEQNWYTKASLTLTLDKFHVNGDLDLESGELHNIQLSPEFSSSVRITPSTITRIAGAITSVFVGENIVSATIQEITRYVETEMSTSINQSLSILSFKTLSVNEFVESVSKEIPDVDMSGVNMVIRDTLGNIVEGGQLSIYVGNQNARYSDGRYKSISPFSFYLESPKVLNGKINLSLSHFYEYEDECPQCGAWD